jgi:hypothetical protein
MILSKRERSIAVATVAVVAALLLDRWLVTPYLGQVGRQGQEKRRVLDDIARGRSLIEHRKEMTPEWEALLQAGLPSDAASAEGTVLNVVRSWAEDSGLMLTSLKPERSLRRGKMQELAFQAVCSGTMDAVTRFLWKVETAGMPLKINDLQVVARKEGADDLTLQVRIAALSLSGIPAGAAEGTKTESAAAGRTE